MAASDFDNTQRNVIPRWRESSVAKRTIEVLPLELGVSREFDETFLHEKEHEWTRSPSIISAAEFLGSATVFSKRAIAAEAAQFLIRVDADSRLGHWARRFLEGRSADEQLSFQGPMTSRIKIRELRTRLRIHPHDPLAWADLSREFTSIGRIEKARRSMQTATSLAPNSRFVIRAASRLYVHLDEPDRAHWLLLNTPATKSDPWLLAAELSVASVADTTPHFVTEARSLLNQERFPMAHLNEMASALATLELRNGNTRPARRLFNRALANPSENTVAQVKWAARYLGEFKLSADVLEVPLLFEAKAINAYLNGHWKIALEESERWLDDEPFSTRPATLGSYIAISLLNDIQSATAIIRRGLEANPNDFGLANNLVVALTYSEQFDAAYQQFKAINRESLNARNLIVWNATSGLMNFRNGHIDAGRKDYHSAVALASSEKQNTLLVRAMAAWIREEVRAKTGFSQTLRTQLDAEIKSTDLDLATEAELAKITNIN